MSNTIVDIKVIEANMEAEKAKQKQAQEQAEKDTEKPFNAEKYAQEFYKKKKLQERHGGGVYQIGSKR